MNTCNKCKMVKYCNAACKKKHRTKHKKKCERRVAELHDEQLYSKRQSLKSVQSASFLCQLIIIHPNSKLAVVSVSAMAVNSL